MATDTSPTPIAAVGVAEVGVAEDRLTRLFARFMTSGYLVYLLLLAPTIIRQNRVVATWWTIVAVIAVFGPPVAMGAAAFHRDLRWTRYAAVVTATGFVAAAALWPLAWNGRLLHSDAWISTIPGLAGLAAALAWPPVRTIALLVAAVVPVQLINHHCRAAGHNGPLIPELLFALSFCLLYVGAALMAMRTGRLLDATR
ncbi:MAG: ATP-binding protein, partial [Nocardia sp.]|nr:ATP-binding protein [Nocardia sp.]